MNIEELEKIAITMEGLEKGILKHLLMVTLIKDKEVTNFFRRHLIDFKKMIKESHGDILMDYMREFRGNKILDTAFLMHCIDKDKIDILEPADLLNNPAMNLLAHSILIATLMSRGRVDELKELARAIAKCIDIPVYSEMIALKKSLSK